MESSKGFFRHLWTASRHVRRIQFFVSVRFDGKAKISGRKGLEDFPSS